MKITIEYDSCWRNAFLGGSNNEPVPEKGRKFLGSMKSLKEEGNFKVCEHTLDTVMGVLNRLIGDQRKLYQARSKMYEGTYYFEDLESKVTFTDKPQLTNEMTFIRNMNGSTDQNSFSGAIKANSPALVSDFSMELWGVLGLSLNEVCTFIVDDNFLVDVDVSLNPIELVSLANYLDKKLDLVDFDSSYEKVINIIHCDFPDVLNEKEATPYVERNGKIKPIRLYSAALYIQLERLSKRFDMKAAVTKAGKIAGFSKRGFNGQRDFMKNFVTGGEKTIWGNPYIKKEKIKGQGEVTSMMTKASGQLEITIDVERDKAQEIKTLIENAGVSSFYLGKKGLAYVSNIRL